MAQRETDRRRELARSHAHVAAHRGAHPVLALQRSIGNRAVAQVLARDPVPGGSVQIGGIGTIKVKDGGNLAAWAGGDVLNTVEVTSQKGKHSAKLAKLSDAGTKGDVKVTIDPAYKSGEELNVGGGTLLEIQAARVKDYAIKDGVETWRLTGFENVKRTKITHRIGSG
jgi:hypothetical protein